MSGMTTSLTVAEEFLLELLEEEFSRYPDIRVDIRKENGERGVLVRSESREWFFPFEWSSTAGFGKVHQQINTIRELYS